MRRVGYILGAVIVIGFLLICLFSIRYDDLHIASGGSASVAGCGIAIGGASGDGKPGQVVIRKCPQ